LRRYAYWYGGRDLFFFSKLEMKDFVIAFIAATLLTLLVIYCAYIVVWAW